MIKIVQTVLLLVISNAFMTFAWYGHLHYKKPGWVEALGLLGIVLASWLIAFFEYIFMVPANRIGFKGNGGPFTMFELKTLQEAISVTVFILINVFVFRTEKLAWNHVLGFLMIIIAVYIIYRKW